MRMLPAAVAALLIVLPIVWSASHAAGLEPLGGSQSDLATKLHFDIEDGGTMLARLFLPASQLTRYSEGIGPADAPGLRSTVYGAPYQLTVAGGDDEGARTFQIYVVNENRQLVRDTGWTIPSGFAGPGSGAIRVSETPRDAEIVVVFGSDSSGSEAFDFTLGTWDDSTERGADLAGPEPQISVVVDQWAWAHGVESASETAGVLTTTSLSASHHLNGVGAFLWSANGAREGLGKLHYSLSHDGAEACKDGVSAGVVSPLSGQGPRAGTTAEMQGTYSEALHASLTFYGIQQRATADFELITVPLDVGPFGWTWPTVELPPDPYSAC